jgi:hypothetical protein
MSSNIVGVYKYADDLLDAAGKLRQSGFEHIELMSPIPLHGVEAVLGPKKSILRRCALFGAITGALGGFLMAALSAIVFVLPSGGRPIVPWPPFLLVTYETTILLGTLGTLIGFFFSAGLPAWKDRPYVPAFSDNRFGVHVGCDEGAADKAEKIMLDAGAEKVERVKL